MNLYNIWVSLSEMRDKNIDFFHDIHFLFRCTCILSICKKNKKNGETLFKNTDSLGQLENLRY